MKKTDLTKLEFKLFFYQPSSEWVAECISGKYKGLTWGDENPITAMRCLVEMCEEELDNE